MVTNSEKLYFKVGYFILYMDLTSLPKEERKTNQSHKKYIFLLATEVVDIKL